MKLFPKLIITFLLVFCLFCSCFVSAHAAESDSFVGGLFWDVIEWAAGPEIANGNEDYELMLRKVWSQPAGISGTLSVSYDFLSDLCVELNMRGYPCHIARSNTAYRIVGDGYILNQTSRQNIDGRYLCTTNGAALEAPTNTNVLNLIDAIRVYITNIFDQVSDFRQKFIKFTDVVVAYEEYMIKAFHLLVKEDGLLNNLIAAVENLTITGGNVSFDTKPITDKLTELKTAVNNKGTSIVDAINNIDVGTSKVTASIVNNCATIVNAVKDISLDTAPVVNAINTKGSAIVTAVNGIKLDTTPITNKLDVVIEELNDDSILNSIRSNLGVIAGQFQGGTVVGDTWYPTTIYDYVQGIYNQLPLSDSGGNGTTTLDGSLIANAIRTFQSDFDETFSDLKQVYPIEVTETIRSGVFEWSEYNMLNSYEFTDPAASLHMYRIPKSNLDVEYDYIPFSGVFFSLDNFGLPIQHSNYLVDVDGDRKYFTLPGTEFVEAKEPDHWQTEMSFTARTDGTFDTLVSYGLPVHTSPSVTSPELGYCAWPDSWPSISWTNTTTGETRSSTLYFEDLPDNAGAGYLAGRAVPVSSGGNYFEEDAGSWWCDVVDFKNGTYAKYIDVITLDGSEDWTRTKAGTSSLYFAYDFAPYGSVLGGDACTSTHFGYTHITTSTTGVGIYVLNSSAANSARISVRPGFDNNMGVAEWKAWLAENPVTVYYVRSAPVIYTASSYSLPGFSAGENIIESAGALTSLSFNDGLKYMKIVEGGIDGWFGVLDDGTRRLLPDDIQAVFDHAFYDRTCTSADFIEPIEGTVYMDFSTIDGGVTLDYIKGSKFFNWLYLYLNNFDDGGSLDIDALLDKLTDIENALSNIGGDVNIENNTDIDINEDNDSYNVFYVEDPETGEETSIIDLSGDALTAFGKLLNFLYQIGFENALSNFGDTVDGLTDFYMDSGEGSVDVWAS